MTVRCEACGVEYGIGDSPFCRDGHGRVLPSKGFEPRFDYGLGQDVTGWGDIRQAMRRNQLDYRDHPSPGDRSARLDRIADLKRGSASPPRKELW